MFQSLVRYDQIQTNLQDISEGTNVRSLLIGLATTAFAGLCFTSGNTLVKLLPPGSSYDILLLRSLIQVQHVVITDPYRCCFSKYVNFCKLFAFAYSSNSFSKMQLMLPLVIRADTGFYGAEDLATRLAKKTITIYAKLEINFHSFFRCRVVGQGALGGFLLLSVMQAVSRYVSYLQCST